MPFIRLQHNGGAVSTTLASTIGSGDIALTLAAATGWPDGSTGPFYIVVGQGIPTEEKILVTARSGTSLTGLTRGADGTAASAHTSGEIIAHIYSATEADEANNLVHATLGTVTTKGDLTPATGSGVLARLPAGSNGLPLVANTGATTGLNYAQLGSAGLAAAAVTSTQLAAGAVTSSALAPSAVGTAAIATGAVTATQIAANTITASQIAASTITTAQIANGTILDGNIAGGTITADKMAAGFWHYTTFSGTTNGTNDLTVTHGAGFTPAGVWVQITSPSGGPNQGFPVVTAVGGTTFTVRFLNTAGSMATQAVAGYFLCLP